MTPHIDSWTIVLPGAWNPLIFRPNWITGRLTAAQEVGVEVAFGDTVGPLRFRFDGVHLRADPVRLVLGVDVPSDASLTKIENIAIQILEALPHTPIRGAGINFGFLEKDPSTELVQLFHFADTDKLADAGFVVGGSHLKRKLRFDEDRYLNLALELRSDGALGIDANFHGEVGNTEATIRHLDGHVVELKNKIVRLLEDAYELVLTPEDS